MYYVNDVSNGREREENRLIKKRTMFKNIY